VCSLAIKTGQQAEALAVAYLKQQGLQIVKTNYQCKMGEIDIICKNSRHVIFVEVRYRSSTAFGGALESITPQKISRIIKTAQYFLKYHFWTKMYFSRFDIIAISPKNVRISEINSHNVEVNWIQNAFSDG
jgi:putative endonuclease